MIKQERISIIESRLTESFNPMHLEIHDDSAEHIGHVGSAHGAGHYTVVIKAEVFKTMSRIAVHRAVMRALADLIPKEIHALRIRVVSSS